MFEFVTYTYYAPMQHVFGFEAACFTVAGLSELGSDLENNTANTHCKVTTLNTAKQTRAGGGCTSLTASSKNCLFP